MDFIIVDKNFRTSLLFLLAPFRLFFRSRQRTGKNFYQNQRKFFAFRVDALVRRSARDDYQIAFGNGKSFSAENGFAFPFAGRRFTRIFQSSA